MAALQRGNRHVEHGQVVGHEEGVELPPFQRLDEALQMREVEVGVRVGARVAPCRGVDGGRAHEGAEMELAFGGHGRPRMADRFIIGDMPRRREDARFATGRGSYLDDLRFDRLTHAVLLRSPHAHAAIERLDAATARAMPGVLAVLTGSEAQADGLLPMRPTMEANVQTSEKFAFAPQPLLATEKV